MKQHIPAIGFLTLAFVLATGTVVWLVGIGTRSDGNSYEIATTETSVVLGNGPVRTKPEDAKAVPVTHLAKTQRSIDINSKRRRGAHEGGFTNVKRDILLTVVNVNVSPDASTHHHFEFKDRKADVEMYSDLHSDAFIFLTGSPDDLEVISVNMKLEDILRMTAGGEIDPAGLITFVQCVGRVSTAIDPSWSEDLMQWATKMVPFALFGDDILSTRHNHLLVHFETVDGPGGVSFLSLMIGVEAP